MRGFCDSGFALIEPVAFTVHFQDVQVVGQPVQQRACETLCAEGFCPIVEREIAGYQCRAAFVALRDELEQ